MSSPDRNAPTVLGTPGLPAHPPRLVAPEPSSVLVGPSAGAQIAEVGSAPTDTPLVLIKGDDGVLRPRPLPEADQHTHWADADEIRVSTAPPTDAAPLGAVHLDASSGRLYRNGERAT